MASAWGNSWGVAWGDSWGAIAAATPGVGKRRRYPRWVIIDGQRYRVENANQERQLLQAMADRANDNAKLAEALGDSEVAAVARKRAIRVKARLPEVDNREAEWMAQLIAEDEEIISLLN